MCHMLCPIFVCTFLATPQITGTTSMQTCTEKGTDDIGKDAMLVYTVSNMYFYTWLQHIYMLMLETVLLCSLWFHQSRFHLEIKRFFTTKTIEKRVPHTHTSIDIHVQHFSAERSLYWVHWNDICSEVTGSQRPSTLMFPVNIANGIQWSHASVRHGFLGNEEKHPTVFQRGNKNMMLFFFNWGGAILRWLVPKFQRDQSVISPERTKL